MAPIGAFAKTRYSALLNQAGAPYFDVAVFPPVRTSIFGLGTVYTCTPSGEIDTIDDIPRMSRTERDTYIVNELENFSTLFSKGVTKSATLPTNYYLPSVGIYNPETFTPSEGDRFLDLLSAPPRTEAAFLFGGNSCSVTRFAPTFRDECNWWQQIKKLHFEQSNGEILLVIDLQNEASYVMNSKEDGYYDTRISDLQLLHNSQSNVAQAAPWGNMEHYTIVYEHVRVQKSKFGLGGNWLLRFQSMLKTFGKSFTLQKPLRPRHEFEMEPHSGNISGATSVSRLYLGSSLYLLEEYESGFLSYALESEGHAEGFYLGAFISNMDAYALQNGITDSRAILADVFPPEKGLPVTPAVYWQFLFQSASGIQPYQTQCDFEPNNRPRQIAASGCPFQKQQFYNPPLSQQYDVPQAEQCRQPQYGTPYALPQTYYSFMQ